MKTYAAFFRVFIRTGYKFEWLQVRVVWHVDYSKSTPTDVAVLESVSLLFNNYTLFPSFMLM